MNTNVGTADRVIRIILGLAMLSAVLMVEGPLRWVGLSGAILIFTAVRRWCPFYALLGLRTCPVQLGADKAR
jgi:hypothetical protein